LRQRGMLPYLTHLHPWCQGEIAVRMARIVLDHLADIFWIDIC
jgi:hypothetical protein